jgi:hypothetical protein
MINEIQIRTDISNFAKNLKFIVFLLLFLLLGCNREESIQEVRPLIKTNEVQLTSEGVVLSGEFILSGTYRSIHYGFQLDTDPSFSDPIVIEAGSNKQPNSFQARVYTDLDSKKKYYIRTWAKSEKYDVLGNRLEFANTDGRKDEPAPLISKVIPETALWGDTIKIIGKYFDFFGYNNKVLFNGVESKIWNHQDTIWAIIPNVPAFQNIINVAVKVDGKTTDKESAINLTPPVITGLSKNEGQYPDTIVINGDNFTKYGTSVVVDGREVEITDLTKKTISFIFPFLKDEKKAKVELSRSINYLVTNDFQYHRQEILQLSKNEAWIGDTIKLYGKNIDFKRILINIRNSDPKIPEYSQPLTITNRWNDSMQFILKGSYDAPKFNLEVQFGKTILQFPFKAFATVAEKEVNHKAPVIESLEKKEYVYRETVNWKSKGVYLYGGDYGWNLIKSLDGQISLKSYTSNTHSWGSGDLIPGEYSLQLYSYNRLSNIEYFTVKEPTLISVSYSIDRDNRFQVSGKNLPYFTDYLLTHLRSGRTFSIRNWWEDNGNYSTQEVDPVYMIGAGDYQVEIKIGQKLYRCPGTIYMKDYFDYLMKATDPISQSSSVGCGFSVNNKLYVPQQSGTMSIIDLSSGNVRSKTGYYNYDHQPVFLNNKIYMIIYKQGQSRYALCSFNDVTEDWDEVNMEGFPSTSNIMGIGVFNNHLLTISGDGSVYQFDQKWTLIKNIKNFQSNLYFIHYIYSRDDKLYLCDFYKGLICVVTTSDWTFFKKINMPAMYDNSLRYIFEKEGLMYYCAKPGGGVSDQYNFYKFTPEETFQALSPKKMANDWYYHFCPDGKGNVYFINQGYIYKFNPR